MSQREHEAIEVALVSVTTVKRLGKVWGGIIDKGNLRLAHKKASEDKSYYHDVKMVNSDPDKYLDAIQEMLINHTYKVSKYHIQQINDKGKSRTLMKLRYYPDRIIQWAIMLQIEPMMVKNMCRHTCASIPKRGGHKVQKLMKEYLKDEENSQYTYKIDIEHFYPNIDHEILKQQLRKKIKDVDLLWLLDTIIDSYPGEKGLPIGSYLSQYLANFYLSEFDHWLKEKMHIKKVVRYMDDMVVMARTAKELHSLHLAVTAYLWKKLKLKVKSNWQVFHTESRGVDFVGYRHFHEFRLLRKSTAKRLRKLCNTIFDKQIHGRMINYREWCAVNSYVGWLIWCDSWRLYEAHIEMVKFSVLKYYRYKICEKYRKTDKAKIRSFEKYAKKFSRKKGRCAA